MSRYLTPSKVGLLALISLYTDYVIPSAATIPILSFLVSHLLPADSGPVGIGSIPPSSSSSNSIHSLQQVTKGHASGIPGRTVWDLLLNRLWEINSFDALHGFFDNLSALLEKPREGQGTANVDVRKAGHIRLSRVSPLGAFVRRSQLEFTRLQFHDGVGLWTSFVTYRSSTLLQWRKRHPGVGHDIDINLQETTGEPTKRIRDIVYGDAAVESKIEAGVSTEDVEKLLQYQVDHMQSTNPSTALPKPTRQLTARQRWAVDRHRN